MGANALKAIDIFSELKTVGPSPKWVLNNKIPRPPKKKVGDFLYLLDDNQIFVRPNEVAHFCHKAVVVYTPVGVEQFADHSFVFNPEYEKIVFHKINVIRKGEVLNQLEEDACEIRFMQREESLHEKIHNGDLTCHLVFFDVRPGDVVEFSYSILGTHPVFLNNYSGRFLIQYSIPIGRIFLRMLCQKGQSMNYFNEYSTQGPQIKENRLFKEFIWDIRDQKARRYNTSVPGYEAQYPAIVFTQFDRWRSISKFLSPHYQVNHDFINFFNYHAQDLFKEDQLELKITNAIRFVQNEIRYTALNEGMGGFIPRSPLKVLKRRFGDCKDKTVMLICILKMLGIKAHAVLANTNLGHPKKDVSPYPYSFNHIIALIEHEGREYLIDPTHQNQGGVFPNIAPPDYGFVLPIKDDGDDLRVVNSSSFPSQVLVKEIFDMAGAASLVIETKYIGDEADFIRPSTKGEAFEYFRSDSFNYFKSIYPQIVHQQDFDISDNFDANEITIREKYTADSFWSEKDYGEGFGTFARSLSRLLLEFQNQSADYGSYIAHPKSIDHHTRVILPVGINCEIYDETIENEIFSFESSASEKGRELSLKYHFHTKVNYIQANQQKELKKHLISMEDCMGYEIPRPGPENPIMLFLNWFKDYFQKAKS